jgi:hypothetical protein
MESVGVSSLQELIQPFVWLWDTLHWWLIPIIIVVLLVFIVVYEVYINESHMRIGK